MLSGSLAIYLPAAAANAQTFELDSLLPAQIPGYGSSFAVGNDNVGGKADNMMGWQLGDVVVSPDLSLQSGFDSAPNGASPGSALLRGAPAVALTDTQIGLGAFAGISGTEYPEASMQDNSDAVIALGERAVLTQQTVTVSAAYVSAQLTGFALVTSAIPKPISFSVADARADDLITFGLFTVRPEIAVRRYDFAAFASQSRTDTRESLTTAFVPGGPAQLVLRLAGSQSAYDVHAFDADTTELLAGVEDDSLGVYKLRFLAGAARRVPAAGPGFSAPVIESAVDYLPDELDQLRLLVVREIDDPDELSAVSYTLNQAEVSLRHEYSQNVILRISATVANAAYLQSPLRETLFATDAAVIWQLNPAWAVTGDYVFNDRQANFLRAANEHVMTLGVTWSP